MYNEYSTKKSRAGNKDRLPSKEKLHIFKFVGCSGQLKRTPFLPLSWRHSDEEVRDLHSMEAPTHIQFHRGWAQKKGIETFIFWKHHTFHDLEEARMKASSHGDEPGRKGWQHYVMWQHQIIYHHEGGRAKGWEPFGLWQRHSFHDLGNAQTKRWNLRSIEAPTHISLWMILDKVVRALGYTGYSYFVLHWCKKKNTSW